MFKKSFYAWGVVLALALGATPCRTLQAAPPSATGSIAASNSSSASLTKLPVFDVIPDSMESFNRGTWSFNKGFFNYFVHPLNKGYQFIAPEPVRKSIGKFGWNLKYPVHLLNNLFQGKFRGAGRETNRFLINTTVGLLGFFDPAKSYFHIEPSREDFEQTLGSWGNGPGTYVMLPFSGPSSGRNIVGRIVDFPFDFTSWIFGARAFLSNNKLSFNSERLAHLINDDADPYVLVRNMWALDRERQVEDYEITPAKGDAEPSLESIFLGPRDPKFVTRGKTRHALIPATGRKLAYTCWIQKEKAPFVLILPGLGSHRLDSGSVALAEMAYNNGYSAVTLSSTMNWEFMSQAATTPVPGHPYYDSLDIIAALKAIRDDLRTKYHGQAERTALLGYSLGGIQTLEIAALEAQGRTDGKLFDRYLAINPPPDMFFALRQIDNYFNAPLSWPAENREANIKNTLLKAITMGQGEINPAVPFPLTRTESEFLIGLNFRLILRNVIFTGQSINDLGVLTTPVDGNARQPRYNEIRQYSYEDYMDRFVLPYYLKSLGGRLTKDQFIKSAALTSLTPLLKNNEKVWVHTNANDFLTRPEDFAWFRLTFGGHFQLFEGGGHLGNLYLPEVQDRIMKSLAGLK